MKALYAQYFLKTDSCPNLEMPTFASDSKSDAKVGISKPGQGIGGLKCCA